MSRSKDISSLGPTSEKTKLDTKTGNNRRNPEPAIGGTDRLRRNATFRLADVHPHKVSRGYSFVQEGIYIYGIIKTNEHSHISLLAAPRKQQLCLPTPEPAIYAIPYADLSAVVSDSSIFDYSTMLRDAIARHLVRHQTVIERIMQDGTIVPVKFGTVVQDRSSVLTILETAYDALKDLLSQIEDKIELDVVATWTDLRSELKEIGEQDEITRLKAEVSNKPPDEAIQEKIRIGCMVKTLLDKRRDEGEKEIVTRLRRQAVEFRRHDVMDDRMIMNTAFLVQRSKRSSFETALNTLNEELHENVNFRCVGPLPPYSFSTIEIKTVDPKEMDNARGLLRLGPEPTPADIKRAYKHLARQCHPDSNPGDTQLQQKFEELTEAFKLLSACTGPGRNLRARQHNPIFVDVLKV